MRGQVHARRSSGHSNGLFRSITHSIACEPPPACPSPTRRGAHPFGHNEYVRVSAKADYAVRATIELAAGFEAGPIKGEQVAGAQNIPLRFLENIGAAESLREVWVALRNNVRGILDNVTLADVIADRIPAGVKELGKKPDLRAY